MLFSHKTRVGVLRGGPSPEYDVSLNTGKTILSNLPEEYEPIDVFISKEGVWHTGGFPKEPYAILKNIDVAFNAMHGAYGEDGTVQRLLENFNIPYTGSDAIASAIATNKIMSKDIFRRAGLKTPHYAVLERSEDGNKISDETIKKINESLPFPIVVKPFNSGSSLGVSLVDRSDQIERALKKSFQFSPKLIIEEYIDGREATCGVVENFRGEKVYVLLPAEISKNKKKDIYNYDSKYTTLGSRCKIPGDWSEAEKSQIQENAALVHQMLGLRHYSRTDFILHPKRGLFVLEVNTLPELSHRSSFVKSLEAVGSNIKEFLSHLLSKTLGKK